jgi:hypothetical protein
MSLLCVTYLHRIHSVLQGNGLRYVFHKVEKRLKNYVLYVVSELVSWSRFMIIFFASMAYHLSEQASHLVSRGSLRP